KREAKASLFSWVRSRSSHLIEKTLAFEQVEQCLLQQRAIILRRTPSVSADGTIFLALQQTEKLAGRLRRLDAAWQSHFIIRRLFGSALVGGGLLLARDRLYGLHVAIAKRDY